MYKMEYEKEWAHEVYIKSVKKEGLEIGKVKEKKEMAFRLKTRGETIEAISEITELAIKDLEELFKSTR